jgi:mannose-6-phosphate isomerase-like protein (cupin superfamily)
VTFREDELGAGWGTMILVPGGEKPLRYTDRFHYIFYVVSGAAVVTFGDTYAVPCRERTVREHGLWEVRRGNYYSLRNDSAAVPATIFFARVCRFGNSKGQHAVDKQDGMGRDDDK